MLRSDAKRINFVNIQHGSGISAEGYEVTGLRTGYEKIVAHRTSNQQTNIAEANGKVVAVSGDLLTIEYSGKKETYTKSYKLGRYFGRHEGGIFPHDMTTKLKVGDSVKKNDVVTFNERFFEPDVFNPSQVNWKAGAMALVALIEGADTLEDSSAISPRLSKLLKTQITKEKVITVRFDQAVHGLVKPGDRVEPETILCTIEDSLTATSGAFTDKSLEHLQSISDQTPQPKITGVIDQIEVFYNGELDDMIESVRQVAMYGDRLRKKAAAVNPDRMALTGQVDSSLRIGGHPVEMDTIVIRVYITQDVPAIGGDKGVFANQMKSTFRNVMIGKNTTEDGTPLDGYFGKKSVDERIVLSVFKIGTANILCRLESERCQKILAGE